MNIVRYPVERLLHFLQKHTVATLPQLKTALGTTVTLTVLRKLSPLDYRSSYSHGGAYYTLDRLAHYDELGLWSHRDIHFSRHGTLLNTAEALVTQSVAGCLTAELDSIVGVATKDALRHLVEAQRLARRDWKGLYLYCAPDRARGRGQWAARQAQHQASDDVQAAKALFFSRIRSMNHVYAGLQKAW